MSEGDGALCPSCLRHGERDHARERRQAPVPLPRGVSLVVRSADAGAGAAYRGSIAAVEEIEIHVRRATWREVASALAVLPWLAIAYASSPIGARAPVPVGRWIFSLAFVVAGLFIVRGPLRKLVSRVRIRASRAGLTVEEVPFGARERTFLAAEEVAQLHVPSMAERQTDDGFAIPMFASVLAQRRDGQQIHLLGGLETVEQARFIEQQLESALGIEDRPVEGEESI